MNSHSSQDIDIALLDAPPRNRAVARGTVPLADRSAPARSPRIDTPQRSDPWARPSDRLDASSRPGRLVWAPTQVLRVLFALGIVLHHGLELWPAAQPLQRFGFGTLAVYAFFVITAFGIEVSLAGASRPPTARAFLSRRLLRLLPMYWLVTLLLAALMWRRDLPVPLLDELLPSLLLWPHWSMVHPDRIWPILVPGWSLTYVVGYCLLAAVCLALPHRRTVMAAVLLGLPALGGLVDPREPWLLTLTSPSLVSFVGGLVVARLFLDGWFRSIGWTALMPLGIALIGIGQLSGSLMAKSLGGAVFFAGVLPLGTARLLDRATPLMTIGAASYSIYLVHTLVQGSALRHIGLERLDAPGGALIFVTGFVLLPIAVGLVVHRLVERPMGDWLQARFEGRARAATRTD